jgi:hypothetical protein
MSTAGAQSAELITTQVERPPDLLAPLPSHQGLFHLGMFQFIPQMDVNMTYDDNIFATPANKVHDFIWTIAPGITAVASDPRDGKLFSLSYIPSFVFYTENPDQNNIGQVGTLAARLPLNRLTLGLGGTAALQQSALQGTGELVETRTFTGQATSQYALSGRTSAELNGGVSVQDGEDVIGNTTWDASTWLNYTNSAHLTLGIGASFNYQTVEDSPNQTFQSLLFRAVYTINERLVFRAVAGPEWRQYDGARSDTVEPFVTLGASWQIGNRTTVNFDAAGRVVPSLDTSGQNYYMAMFRLYLIQNLTEKFSITAGGGYEHDHYYSTVSGVPSDGPVDMLTLGGSLNYQIRPNWSASIFYNYRDSTGNATITSFTDNQAGIRSSWHY